MIFSKRRKREEYIRYIETHIERGNQWVRAAFYSDPYVSALLEELYRRWYANNSRGEPIDYASDEELEKLYQLARKYASLTPYEAFTLYMDRREAEEEGEEQ